VSEIEHGDISNAVMPRFLFVFEGVLGTLPNEAAARRSHLLIQLHQYRRAVRCYELSTHMSKVLWDLAWRQSIQFDVVTFLGEGMADAVRDRLDEIQLPVSHVSASTPDDLAKSLVFRPNIVQVVHSHPEWAFKFGPAGRYVETTEGFSV
jgi:hypothetical protein